jgi:GNAT superfamily N-acetyltransferase
MLISEIQTNNMIKQDSENWENHNGRPKKVLPIKIDNFDVRYSNLEYIPSISVWDGRNKIAYLEIVPVAISDLKLYKVKSSKVRPLYQGRGIGEALYRGLVLFCDVSLAGIDHSQGARKLWARLSQDPKISTWAVDDDADHSYRVIANPPVTELVLAANGKRIYGNSEYTAVIVTKKNSSNDKKLIQMSKKEKLGRDVLGTHWGNDWVDDYLN